MMSNALSSMWRGSESKLSQHCLKVRIQIPSHLRAYSQLWVTVTSTIKLYTSSTQRHGAGILTWKAENGRRMGNQDWTKAVWELIQQGTHKTLQLSPCLVSRIHRDIIWATMRLGSLDSPWFSVSAICNTHAWSLSWTNFIWWLQLSWPSDHPEVSIAI